MGYSEEPFSAEFPGVVTPIIPDFLWGATSVNRDKDMEPSRSHHMNEERRLHGLAEDQEAKKGGLGT